MECSNSCFSRKAIKLAKLKTRKLSESKYKGRKVTDIGKENEEPQKQKTGNPQYSGTHPSTNPAQQGLALVIS